jgi:hypothetical protein
MFSSELILPKRVSASNFNKNIKKTSHQDLRGTVMTNIEREIVILPWSQIGDLIKKMSM